ncbi:MAG: carbon-nitrogen family hydrolase [Ardenticatenaceae bacterium]|nr:carbon-nitrogen family hydrolase [Ardenticatenaceae bacterium]
MDVVLGEPEQNLATARRMVAEAAQRGSDVVVLPELWSTGYDLENAARYATPTDAGIFAEAAQLARQNGIAILGSCLSLLGEDAHKDAKYGNTAVYINSDGQILGQYSKIHLFQLMDEHLYLTGGEKLTVVETEWGLGGLSICYDLRFPELFRAYALSGVQMVFLPSEWPHPRLAHWQTLLRARAIENQMYVIACNRVGNSKNTDFFGHSCIIDPWGEIVVEAGESEVLLTAEIDLGKVDAARAKIPIFADRRPELYL